MVSAIIGKSLRKRQKGKKCSIGGCADWCVSNDLCNKHNMAARRYGSVYGGKDGHRKGVCYCGKEFVVTKIGKEYCSGKCYRNTPGYKKAAYERTKKHRELNKDKSRARDIVSKSINREASMIREVCEVCAESEADAHHPNYSNPRNVIFLCKDHHNEIHSWDSN